MKKKWIKRGIFLLIVITVLLIFVFNQINKFYTNGLNTPIIGNSFTGSVYEDYEKGAKFSVSVIESKKIVLSNIFFIKRGNIEQQIRFRLLISDPFYNDDILKHTDFLLQNEKGVELNYAIHVYSEDFLGCQGINIILIFSSNIYLPSSGEKLSLDIVTSKAKTKVQNKSDTVAYSKFELIMP